MKKKRKKIYVFFTLFLAVIIGISFYINGVVNSLITDYAHAKVSTMTTSAVNKAIFGVLEQELLYNDLVNVNTDLNGNVQFIEANTVKINDIAKKTADKAKTELDKINEAKFDIHLGSLTKSPLLNGYGPLITIKILSSGSVICRFKSHFTGAGVNQTRHRIFIEVFADMNLVLPTAQKSITSTVEIFVAEAVIVGQVPNTYLNFNSGYNFLPNEN